jgi:hypothetical protein
LSLLFFYSFSLENAKKKNVYSLSPYLLFYLSFSSANRGLGKDGKEKKIKRAESAGKSPDGRQSVRTFGH